VVDREDDPQATAMTCSAGAPNDCSLRGALIEANSNGAGSDTINFDVPGGGVKTIILSNRLPDIKSSLIINGATQAGYGGKPVLTEDSSIARIGGGRRKRQFGERRRRWSYNHQRRDRWKRRAGFCARQLHRHEHRRHR